MRASVVEFPRLEKQITQLWLLHGARLSRSSAALSPQTAPCGTRVPYGLAAGRVQQDHDVVIEYRYGENDPHRLKALIAEILQRPTGVIVRQSVEANAASGMKAVVTVGERIGNGLRPRNAARVASLPWRAGTRTRGSRVPEAVILC